MAANDPYQMGQQMMQSNAHQGLFDMRMMSTANRMEPSMRGGRMYGHQGVSGNPMLASMAGMSNEPDYSQFTFDPQAHAAATQALSHYGLAPLEASDVKRNVLLPNSGFFGAHPRLSAALEGGMFGAVAAHGGETVGDSIQGALEGVIGGQQMKQGMYRQQFARPFEAAGMMERLEDAQQRRELQSADIEHFRALNEHIKNGDDYKAQQLMETNRHQEAMEAYRNSQIESTAPRNLGEGRIGYYHPENMPKDGQPVDPKNPLWEIQQDPEWQKQYNEDKRLARRSANQAGMLKGYQTVPDPHNPGKNIRKYVELPPNSVMPEGFQPMGETYEVRKEDTKSTKADANRDTWVKKQLGTPGPVWMAAGIRPGDKDTSKKLYQYYDENLAPPEPNAPEGNSIPTYDPKTRQLR
jgi:hypothetical protein